MPGRMTPRSVKRKRSLRRETGNPPFRRQEFSTGHRLCRRKRYLPSCLPWCELPPPIAIPVPAPVPVPVLAPVQSPAHGSFRRYRHWRKGLGRSFPWPWAGSIKARTLWLKPLAATGWIMFMACAAAPCRPLRSKDYNRSPSNLKRLHLPSSCRQEPRSSGNWSPNSSCRP